MDVRAQRAAQNENLFRRINERVEALSGDLDTLTIVCECADPSCVQRLGPVPRDRYSSVREHPEQFFVARGHERDDIERVVADHGEYRVVEKQGAAAEVARDDDPR